MSSSLRYDLMPAHDLRITNKVYVNRGYEPTTPYYGYHEVERPLRPAAAARSVSAVSRRP